MMTIEFSPYNTKNRKRFILQNNQGKITEYYIITT